MGTDGVGYNLYGSRAGYTQQQWNGLSQAQRDYVKMQYPNAAHDYNVANYAGNQQIINDQNLGYATQGYPDQAGAQSYDDGGYGGGGSGGGGGLAPRNLATSPEWQAYLNALGLEEGQFRADIDRQRAFAKSAAEQQIAGLGPQYDQQRRGITAGNESRGMARSGGFLRDLAVSRQSQGRDVSNINLGLGSTLSGLESNLANKLMDLGSRRASEELSLRSGGGYV